MNKLFQCKLSNVGHLRISGDECHRNNHGSVFLYTFVCGRLCFKHGQLQVTIHVYEWVDVFRRVRESNKETEGEKGERKREIILICDSLAECIWACWLTAAAGRYKELGGTAESE